MAQLLSNLLGNALTHGASHRPIRVAAMTTDGEHILSVANAGEPIPAAALNIFRPFAVAHGGTLQVGSTMDGTCFTFRMPLQD